MLKIKDNVDLNYLMKELEFKKCEYFYNTWEYTKWGIRIEADTKKISLLPNADIDLLYDLIKADLVEKVDE